MARVGLQRHKGGGETITQNIYPVTLLRTAAVVQPPLKFSHLPLYVLKFLNFFSSKDLGLPT